MEDAPPPDANDLRAKVFRDREYSGDWRVESRAETRAGPGRDQHPAVRPASTEYLTHEMG